MKRTAVITFILVVLAFSCFAQTEWQKRPTETLAWLSDIVFVTDAVGFIGGSDGTLLKTVDGGSSWSKQHKFTPDKIAKIIFNDQNNGWLLCEKSIYSRGSSSVSYLMRTTDGGANWSRVDMGETGRERLTSLIFSKYGSALSFGEGGVFYSLTDGAEEWKRSLTSSRSVLMDGAFTSGSGIVVVGGGGVIMFSEDSGLSWTKATVSGENTDRLNRVFFVNEKLGWAAGNNGSIYQTVGGGRYWRKQSSGTSKQLRDIFFTDTANGWAVGEQGTILASQTGGNIWKAMAGQTRHQLEKIAQNSRGIWIVGFGGTLLHRPAKGSAK